MSDPITRVTMFVPGTPSTAAAWNEALTSDGISIQAGALMGTGFETPPKVSFVPQDGTFRQAFSHCALSDEIRTRLEAVPGALIVHWPIDMREARGQMVRVVTCMRDAGAVAVRLEQSKLGWDVDRWIELFSSDAAGDWHLASIIWLRSKKVIQSCGMHLFSSPDVQVPLKGATANANALGEALNLYQLAEDPLLSSGQTFAPGATARRRVIERWPDTNYPTGHPCHNPYGVWHLGPPGGKSRSLGALELTCVPTLYTVLMAAEKEEAAPLTRKQVLAIRDRAPCIALPPREAQSVERARGYADLNLEHVWEQWRMVRR